jgi:hypothetical protein
VVAVVAACFPGCLEEFKVCWDDGIFWEVTPLLTVVAAPICCCGDGDARFMATTADDEAPSAAGRRGEAATAVPARVGVGAPVVAVVLTTLLCCCFCVAVGEVVGMARCCTVVFGRAASLFSMDGGMMIGRGSYGMIQR